jgi:hypothetical protein
MTRAQYLTRVKDIIRQYDEGAVTEIEAINAIIFYAHGIDEEEKEEKENEQPTQNDTSN